MLIGRLIPGIRILTPVAAGVVDMPAREFLPALAVGGFLYLAGYTLVGFWVGPSAVRVL